MSALRKDSATHFPNRQIGELSALEKEVANWRPWALVGDYAKHYETDRECESLRTLGPRGHRVWFVGVPVAQFKSAAEQIMRRLLQGESTNIVATTLGASVNEIFRLGLWPDVMVCDESGRVSKPNMP